MKVLVTGGAGYIGRALVAKLRTLAHTAIVVDQIPGSHWQLDVATHWMAPAAFDAVVHLAAFPSVIYTDTYKAYRDVQATESAVRVAGRKKFIFASSAAVYGNRADAVVGDPLEPLGFYAWSKVMGEQIAAKAPNCSILRICNVYGGDDTRGVWARFQKAKDENRPAIVYGDGSARRTYCHVDQVVIEIISELKRGCNIRNVVGADWTVKEIADRIGVETVHCPPFQCEAVVNTVK
jgi:UDP-glucose 4-epimerase